MSSPRRKPHRRYLFYRVYCIIALLIGNGARGGATVVRAPFLRLYL